MMVCVCAWCLQGEERGQRGVVFKPEYQHSSVGIAGDDGRHLLVTIWHWRVPVWGTEPPRAQSKCPWGHYPFL